MPRRLRVTRHWFSGEGGLGVILASPDLSGSRRGFSCHDVKGSDETGGAVETLKSFVYVSSVPLDRFTRSIIVLRVGARPMSILPARR